MWKVASSNFKMESDKGFSVPGAFKLDHLQPIEPILFQKIFNLFTLILGGQFLLPRSRDSISWSPTQVNFLYRPVKSPVAVVAVNFRYRNPVSNFLLHNPHCVVSPHIRWRMVTVILLFFMVSFIWQIFYQYIQTVGLYNWSCYRFAENIFLVIKF